MHPQGLGVEDYSFFVSVGTGRGPWVLQPVPVWACVKIEDLQPVNVVSSMKPSDSLTH